MSPFQERLGRFTVQWMTGLNNVVFRLSKGRVSENAPSGAPICLVTTTGRKTGRARTVPLVYVADGEELVVVASKGGMTTHPAWYLNMLADPKVVVETAAGKRPATARTATEAEKARFWPELVAVYEHFDAYQARTTRPIPLVILTPEPG
jgi:deazaflavin-dependent oxidoreductase (nitroreductase family)